MDRLEHGGERPVGIEIRSGGDADGSGDGRPKIGEDIPEQIRCDHNIEPVRVKHEVSREDVDVVLGGLNPRVPSPRRTKPLIPEGHRVHDPVRLGGRGHVPPWSRVCQTEGVFHDSVHPPTCEHGLLHHRFSLGSGVDPTAYLRILSLDVLSDHDEIDVCFSSTFERRLDALQQLDGPDIRVLIQLSSEWDQ